MWRHFWQINQPPGLGKKRPKVATQNAIGAARDVVRHFPPLGSSSPTAPEQLSCLSRSAFRVRFWLSPCRPFVRVLLPPDFSWPWGNCYMTCLASGNSFPNCLTMPSARHIVRTLKRADWNRRRVHPCALETGSSTSQKRVAGAGCLSRHSR